MNAPISPSKTFASRDREGALLSKHLYQTISPTVAVTLTFKQPFTVKTLGIDTLKKTCRLFLNRVNRRLYGSHAPRRKGYKVGSIGSIGYGPYGNHPHAHLALTAPPKLPSTQFISLVREIIRTTKGLDRQCEVKPCHDYRWVQYMLNQRKHDWIAELTYPAKHPSD